MIPRSISSLQHPLVKRLVKLRDDRSFRSQEKSVILTGEALIQDVAAHLPLKTLISLHPISLKAEASYLATPAVMRKIVSLTTEDPVVAEVELPAEHSLENKKLIVVLEGLRDPGNVGTVLRTALALGWDGAFLTPHTADPFNDKALRAARGAPLFLPLRHGNTDELAHLVQSGKMNVYIADVGGKSLHKISLKTPAVLILGHETKGPSRQAQSLGVPISIPMAPHMESLNVASAAAILMYQIQHGSTP